MDLIQKEAFKPLYEIYQDEKSPYLKGTDEMLQWLLRKDIIYYKIYFKNTLCGGIAYQNKGNGQYYLARVFISTDFCSKGIASSAIIMVESYFMDAKLFTLDFPIDRVANRMCYEKCGYKDTGERKKINDKLTLAIYKKLV